MDSISYRGKNVFVFYSSLSSYITDMHNFAIHNCNARSFINDGFGGNSYAIPFLHMGRKLDAKIINEYIYKFFRVVYDHPYLSFYLFGLEGDESPFSTMDVAPLFKGLPNNCLLPDEWRALYEL